MHMGSLRYANFKYNGTSCVKCRIKGKYFRLERSAGDNVKKRHFNLYGVNSKGEEILMTMDHILPKSLGGEDDVRNLQTMCEKCNSKRGNPLAFPLICACPI